MKFEEAHWHLLNDFGDEAEQELRLNFWHMGYEGETMVDSELGSCFVEKKPKTSRKKSSSVKSSVSHQ